MIKIKEQLGRILKADSLVYLIFVILTIAAEILVACGNIFISVFVNLFTLISLILITLYKYRGNGYHLYLALTFIPLIRIIGVAIPLKGIPEAFEFMAVSAPLFIIGIIIAKMVGFTPVEIGFSFNKPLKQLLIALLGLPLGFIEFLIVRPGIKDNTGTPGEIIIWVLIFLCAGLLEEFLFRGILYNAVLKLCDDKKAIFFTSLLYAVLTVSGKSFLNVIFVFIVSVLFCKIFGRLKSILGLSLAHGLINITLYIICPQIFSKLGL